MSATDLSHSQHHAPVQPPAASVALQVRKRNGDVVNFDGERIRTAVEKAFKAELGIDPGSPLPNPHYGQVATLAQAVITWATDRGGMPTVEQIQDEVEKVLMTAGEHKVARRYVLYRESRAQQRREQSLTVTRTDGTRVPLDRDDLSSRLAQACEGLKADAPALAEQTLVQLYDGIPEAELNQAMIMAARARIENEPDYTYVSARLLLQNLYAEVNGRPVSLSEAPAMYRQYLPVYIEKAIAAELLHPSMRDFDLPRLAAALLPERDLQFAYLGLQTLYDRYFIQDEGQRLELPQIFWMRVAMGLCLGEDDAQKTDRAIEFYELLSSFRYTSATPTLFNSGTPHPQLSSCYLSTVQDDLDQIFKAYRDNALLSKWAGGLGNDWTNVRALGAKIKGTGGKSQGVVPFLKIANDGAVAVNQGGKRKGAICAYLESWHLDIEEFLELRKNTGDDRRRTHDMNTANWIPDLFMKRVASNGHWTLFSPNDVPDLHHIYGKAFEEKYLEYERRADSGEIKLHKRISAVDLWRKMLSMLFETGHPWITFKDPSNVRSPQDHAGVVHNSNLCTEILLNNSADETAVCNLGSINLAAHISVEHEQDLFGQPTGQPIAQLNIELLKKTINTALRMLDNVIDLNFYPTIEAKNANMRHRPVGLGLMGFQDALYLMGYSYASDEAVQFADYTMEVISYYAIAASADLARQRGTYSSYPGSKWDRGLLPIDTIDLLETERGESIELDRTARLDWAPVREAIRTHGMRNSNVMAIAPTATISNIVGVTQSIEPTYKNLYVKSNLSGEFTIVNTHLINDLKALELWDADMLEELKYNDGDLADIARIPDHLKDRYKTAFEVEPHWIIECAARRQKWIDMGQSLNLYVNQPSGRKLNDMYFLAWRKGLKTTYYLRGLAATQVEKSTVDINKFGIQPKWMKNKSASSGVGLNRDTPEPEISLNSDQTLTGGLEPPKACSIDNPDCEACQ